MQDTLLSEMIRARALMGFASLVESRGGHAQDLLAEFGIPGAALLDPELPISLNQLACLYHGAAHRLGLDDFGLRLSTHQDISLLGPLALIALHSHTIGEALAGLVRHYAYHTPGARIEVKDASEPEYFCVHYALNLGPGVARRQIMEQSYAMAWRFWAMLAPDEASHACILLQHPAALPQAIYRRYFGCAHRFEQPMDAILLPRRAMTMVIDQANGQLRKTAEQFVSNVVRRHPLNMGRQVQQLVIQQLACGGAVIENIASQLGLHKRTLQRRLGEQGLHFERIVDGLRHTLASQYLADQAITLAQVSALLGYGEQSSFVRACWRWFGAAPQCVRKRIQLENI